MTATTFASLLGGIGLFVLGMGMMTDGLKLAAGGALRRILHSWTSSALRGFLTGALITAVVQSSSAVTVATVGFVNAGLLTLAQAIWVVIGTNVGTTMTGWLVALVGVKVQIGSLALPLLGVGMLVRIGSRRQVRLAGLGQAVAGFGAFFLGIGTLQAGFEALTPHLSDLRFDSPGWPALAAFVGLGILLTVLTQSSSAAIAITLTGSAGGIVPLELAAAAVVGTNIGTTSTAALAAVGATAGAKRVAMAHIGFNLLTGAVALGLLPVLVAVSGAVVAAAGMRGDVPATLAVFHTAFNCLGAALIWPVGPRVVRLLSRWFLTPDEEAGRPRYLDATLAAVPALALQGLILELIRMTDLVFRSARARITATADADDALLSRQGVLRLGQAVREFIGRFSNGTLTDDVVVALPDLIRTVQHLEDIATVVTTIPNAPSAERGVAGPQWDKLREIVLDNLRIPMGSGEERTRRTLDDHAARLEAAYQEIKVVLLRVTAQGQLSVEAMEEALAQAQRLRRCAASAIKAQRRFLPWMDRVDVSA